MNRTRIYKAVALVTAFLITVSAFPAGVLAEEQVPEGPPGPVVCCDESSTTYDLENGDNPG